jgi:predicted phosphodiesterase
LERVWLAFESATMKLRKKKRLLKLFRKAKVEHVFHGHVHENGEYKRNGVHCINAGGTVIPMNKEQQAFFLIEIKNNQSHVRQIPVHLRPLIADKSLRLKTTKRNSVRLLAAEM